MNKCFQYMDLKLGITKQTAVTLSICTIFQENFMTDNRSPTKNKVKRPKTKQR